MKKVEYEKMTDYEKDVLNTFFKVVNEAGPYDDVFGYRTYAECGICIQKKGDTWITYHMERCSKSGNREYKDVYDMAIDLFEVLDKEGTDYCVSHFPKKEEFTNKKNNIKNLKLYTGCLIIVDMVKGFVETGGLSDQDIKRIIPRIIELIKEARKEGKLIVFVKDTHTEDSVEHERFGEILHCIFNTIECELADELKEFANGEDVIIIEKNSTSYMEAPEFRTLMEQQVEMNEFDVVGCCTDICVINGTIGLANYLDQWNRRHVIRVHEDAIATYGEAARQEYVNAANLLMKQQGIQLVKQYKKVA